MRYKLGKKPARPDAVQMKFGSFIRADKLPKPPLVLGHELIGHPWRMLGNDKHSNCVFAGGAHEHMVWTHSGTASTGVDFSTESVLSDYAAATGWDGTDATDNGADMEEAAKYRRHTGLLDDAGKRHKIDAYLALRPGDRDDLALAVWLGGAVGLGLMLPDNADKKFDAHQPWDVETASRKDAGGHYVPCIVRNSRGLWVVVTWGGLQGMTQEYYKKYCDEAICYVSFEMIRKKTGLSPEGFAVEDIKRQLSRLQGPHRHA